MSHEAGVRTSQPKGTTVGRGSPLGCSTDPPPRGRKEAWALGGATWDRLAERKAGAGAVPRLLGEGHTRRLTYYTVLHTSMRSKPPTGSKSSETWQPPSS